MTRLVTFKRLNAVPLLMGTITAIFQTLEPM